MSRFLSNLHDKVSLEFLFWCGGLLYLFVAPSLHFSITLCPLKNLGFAHCPGCGLGTSISAILHGNIIESFSYHPLGLFALATIAHRILVLIRNVHNHQPMKG